MHVTGVAVTSSARLESTAGSIFVADSDLGDDGAYCKLKSARGSVYVSETRDVVESLRVDYRAVNRKSCFALAHGFETPASLAQGAAAASVAKVTRHYDADSNGYVTQAEFGSAKQ